MSTRAYLSTRKGLFELDRRDGGWAPGAVHFLGEPVSMTLADSRDGALYAALNLGHFGVKLHRKDAGSDSWTEIAAPAYRLKPEGSVDTLEWKKQADLVARSGRRRRTGRAVGRYAARRAVLLERSRRVLVPGGVFMERPPAQ